MSGPFKVEVKHKDLSRLITDEGRIKLLSHLSAVAQQLLRSKVQTTLFQWHSLANIYQRGIDPSVTPGSLVVDKDKAVLTLMKPPGTGLDPNMLEQGTSSFSLKEALLKGPTAQRKGYVDVMFRHGAPGKSVHMASMQKDAFAAIVDAAKNSATRRGISGSRKLRGVEALGPKLGTANLKHKLSIYSDLEIIKEKSGGHMYQTFRRVSAKSTSEWRHPGFNKLGLFEKVADEMSKNISKYAEPMLKLLLGDK